MPCRVLLLALAALLLGSPAPAARPREFSPADRAWWSFQALRQAPVPAVANPAWARSPLDPFILARLEQAGLAPAPPAAPHTLVRRLYFDLLGLPPTRQETEAFLRDPSPMAWEQLVDHLLDSPHYGENQARLWLDLVRYADSDGYKADDFRPDAWRYRDYVIAAYNADKPYDRFLSEQLAGDELFPSDPQALIATGYLRHGIYEYNNRDAAGQWRAILNDITDTTADVFLGLGLQCARCHDHKFDPLLQEDYFRLQAFFAPLDPRDATPVLPLAALAQHQTQQAQWEAATASTRQRIAELEAPAREAARLRAVAAFPPETQALLNQAPELRNPYQQQIAQLAWRQVLYEWDHIDAAIKGETKQQLVALRHELAAFDPSKPTPLPTAATAADIGPTAPPLTIPNRESLGPIPPGFPSLLDPAPAAVHPLPHSTGRRSALAAWLAQPTNPLTARVMVNRVWQQHFGQGLTTTTSDLGRLGDPPSHPELLDWLAQRFIQDGWSLKKLHRLILTSATWQQGHLNPNAAARLADPDNRLLGRWTTRRLHAEPIRDALFQATGELTRELGGPPVDTSLPRRAIYSKVLRNSPDPLAEVFDAPQHFQSSPSRDTTTTPTQALFLANSPFMANRAAAMALSLADLPPPDQVDAAWWRTTGRPPTPDERSEFLAFLAPTSSAPTDRSALTDFCPSLLSSSALLYLD